MAGNSELPEPAPLREPKKPRVKMFACANCGGSVTLRYPGASMTVVCENCHSVIDVTNDNYRILTKFFKSTSLYEPVIPLGTRGKLKDKEWEVIGFMVRSTVVSNLYSWSEYLLFNPFYGYRWLTEDSGHWNFITTIKRKPESNKHPEATYRAGEVITLDDKQYKIFNYGSVQVDYVIGEFYWKVIVGSQALAADYIDPPDMLSMEKDDNEVVWSKAEYITPQEIKNAFKVEKKMPWPSGTTAPNEPANAKKQWEKIGFLWAVFLIFLTAAQVCLTSTSPNLTSTQYRGVFTPNTKQADITTPVFTLERDKSNVQIRLNAPVNNSWFYVSGELVNNTNGTSYPFELTSEYYYGTDSDGAWTEGSTDSALTISTIPGGQYYLNIDTESGGFVTYARDQFTLSVMRGIPLYDNYFWIAFFLSIIPLISWGSMRKEEVSRWSNSDFNPYAARGE